MIVLLSDGDRISPGKERSPREDGVRWYPVLSVLETSGIELHVLQPALVGDSNDEAAFHERADTSGGAV